MNKKIIFFFVVILSFIYSPMSYVEAKQTTTINIEIIDDIKDEDDVTAGSSKGDSSTSPDKKDSVASPVKKAEHKKLPTTNEKQNHLILMGLLLLIVLMIITRVMKSKARMGLVLIGCGLSIGTSNVHASVNQTTASANIVAGEMELSTVNDTLNQSVRLSEASQSIRIGTLQLNVKDYCGTKDGWEIMVHSPDFENYSAQYQVQIEDKSITNQLIKVCEDTAKESVVSLETSISLSNSAKAGFYNTTLIWRLQPKVQNKIVE